MKTFGLVLVRAMTALGFLGAAGFTVFFLVRGIFMGALSTGAIAGVFGYFVARDIRALIKGDTGTTDQGPSQPTNP